MDEQFEVLGFCIHCKNEILINEPMVTHHGETYHYKPCFRQLDESDLLFEDEEYVPEE